MSDVQELPTRVLIVDDKRRVREGLRMRIETSSLPSSVRTAENGRQALDLLATEPLDVVLCDLRLKGQMDGIEVTRQVRAHHPGVRVVVFTGYDEGERKKEALEAGVFAFLTKPVDYDELVHTILNINSIRRTERLEQSFRQLTAISTSLQASLDFDQLAQRIVDGVLELGYTCARLYLLTQDEKTVEGKVSRGVHLQERFAGYPIPMESASVISEIFRYDRAEIWNKQKLVEAVGEQPPEPWMTDLALHGVTWVDCPLRVRNRRIGTLAVDRCQEAAGTVYTQDDLEVLGVFSSLAAHALNNSLLYQKEALAHASLEAILRDAPQTVVTADQHGTITFVSPSSERVLGYSPQELEGRLARELWTDAEGSEESGGRIAYEIREELQHGPINKALHLRGKDGQPIPISSMISLLHDEEGEEIGTLAFHKSRSPLEIQSERYRNVLEGFGHGSVLLSRTGRVEFVNVKGERLLGRTREELVGQRFGDLLREPQKREYEQRFGEILEVAEERTLDANLLLPDGRPTPLEARLTPVRESGRVTGVALALSDKGELSALIQSGRLMALGQMVAGIAHEINNPLNNVLMSARSLQDHLRERQRTDDRTERDFRNLEEEASRISNLIRSMRQLANPGDLRLVPTSLNGIVRDSMKFFAARLRNRDIEVVLDLDPGEPEVLADRGRLQQVFVNLIVNAEEAMADQSEPKRLCIETRRGGEGVVRATVSDTGGGIPDEVLEVLFDPFFTTKTSGTGLGLSMCKSIVELHQGSIEARNRLEGRGAELEVTLPEAREAPPAA